MILMQKFSIRFKGLAADDGRLLPSGQISLIGILRGAQGCVVLDRDGFTAKKQTHLSDIVRRLQQRKLIQHLIVN
ncbi:hypothetical protein C5167_026028 [Papaver somniferum]|nr:hypothetical protein C5167_026028 [Papaver somniferum]